MQPIHFLMAVVLVMLAGMTSAGTKEDKATTRAVMHDVFDSLAYLLPLSLMDSPSGDQELIKRKLDILTQSSKGLVAHAGKGDTEFGLLARSFERSAAQIREGFETEDPALAYFSMMDLTQHCVACHARLPDANNYDLGQRLLARINVDALEPQDLAHLHVATRQFDQAAALYEKILLNPANNPIDNDLEGTFIDYLEIEIAVQQNLKRVHEFIKRYRARTDLPHYLKQRADQWMERIAAAGSAWQQAPTLEAGQRYFDQATDLTLIPAGRERAIDDLIAASVLRRYLESNPKAAANDRARAYYLLALIALRTTEIKPAVPEFELLLEATIRTAPKGPDARKAYALLEEYGFLDDWQLAREEQKSGFLNMPELRRLIGL